MASVLEVVLFRVAKVARPSIVPEDEELKSPTSASVVLPSLLAYEHSARQEGGFDARLDVVNETIAFRVVSPTSADCDVAGAVFPVPTAINPIDWEVTISTLLICFNTQARPVVTMMFSTLRVSRTFPRKSQRKISKHPRILTTS